MLRVQLSPLPNKVLLFALSPILLLLYLHLVVLPHLLPIAGELPLHLIILLLQFGGVLHPHLLLLDVMLSEGILPELLHFPLELAQTLFSVLLLLSVAPLLCSSYIVLSPADDAVQLGLQPCDSCLFEFTHLRLLPLDSLLFLTRF